MIEITTAIIAGAVYTTAGSFISAYLRDRDCSDTIFDSIKDDFIITTACVLIWPLMLAAYIFACVIVDIQENS